MMVSNRFEDLSSEQSQQEGNALSVEQGIKAVIGTLVVYKVYREFYDPMI